MLLWFYKSHLQLISTSQYSVHCCVSTRCKPLKQINKITLNKSFYEKKFVYFHLQNLTHEFANRDVYSRRHFKVPLIRYGGKEITLGLGQYQLYWVLDILGFGFSIRRPSLLICYVSSITDKHVISGVSMLWLKIIFFLFLYLCKQKGNH